MTLIRADDIRDMHTKRRLFQQKGIDAVVERCYTKIKNVVRTKTLLSSCVFEIPEFIFGYPIYDLTECIIFTKRHLEGNGYKVSYFFPRLLVVSWESAVKTSKLLTDASSSTFNVKPSGKVVLNLLA